jgi:hypothetical protein
VIAVFSDDHLLVDFIAAYPFDPTTGHGEQADNRIGCPYCASSARSKGSSQSISLRCSAATHFAPES